MFALPQIDLRSEHVSPIQSEVQLHMLGTTHLPPFRQDGTHTAAFNLASKVTQTEAAFEHIYILDMFAVKLNVLHTYNCKQQSGAELKLEIMMWNNIMDSTNEFKF